MTDELDYIIACAEWLKTRESLAEYEEYKIGYVKGVMSDLVDNHIDS